VVKTCSISLIPIVESQSSILDVEIREACVVYRLLKNNHIAHEPRCLLAKGRHVANHLGHGYKHNSENLDTKLIMVKTERCSDAYEGYVIHYLVSSYVGAT